MKKCELTEHDLDNPVRKGRADYHCKDCDEDITLLLALMEQAKSK